MKLGKQVDGDKQVKEFEDKIKTKYSRGQCHGGSECYQEDFELDSNTNSM